MIEEIKYQYSISNDNRVIKLSEQFLKSDENFNNYEVLILRAFSFKNTFQDQKAIETFEVLIKYYPEVVEPLLESVFCLIDIGKFDRARIQLEIALKLEPDNVEVINTLIFIEETMHNFEKVINLSNKAILISDKEPSIWLTLSSAYERLGNFDEAIKFCRKAIEFCANDMFLQKAYNNLGYTYSKMNDLVNAEFYLKKAIQIDAAEPFAYNNLGLVLAKQGDTKRGMEMVEHSLKLNNQNSYAYKNRAKIFLMIESIDLAESDLLRAKELDYEIDYDNEVDDLIHTIKGKAN
jgi:tetratricopeptide (TPR) repeat protein